MLIPPTGPYRRSSRHRYRTRTARRAHPTQNQLHLTILAMSHTRHTARSTLESGLLTALLGSNPLASCRTCSIGWKTKRSKSWLPSRFRLQDIPVLKGARTRNGVDVVICMRACKCVCVCVCLCLCVCVCLRVCVRVNASPACTRAFSATTLLAFLMNLQ